MIMHPFNRNQLQLGDLISLIFFTESYLLGTNPPTQKNEQSIQIYLGPRLQIRIDYDSLDCLQNRILVPSYADLNERELKQYRGIANQNLPLGDLIKASIPITAITRQNCHSQCEISDYVWEELDGRELIYQSEQCKSPLGFIVKEIHHTAFLLPLLSNVPFFQKECMQALPQKIAILNDRERYYRRTEEEVRKKIDLSLLN